MTLMADRVPESEMPPPLRADVVRDRVIGEGHCATEVVDAAARRRRPSWSREVESRTTSVPPFSMPPPSAESRPYCPTECCKLIVTEPLALVDPTAGARRRVGRQCAAEIVTVPTLLKMPPPGWPNCR